MSKTPRDVTVINNDGGEVALALRVLWAIVERQGGTLVMPHEHIAESISGSMHVLWGEKGVTICVAQHSPTASLQ